MFMKKQETKQYVFQWQAKVRLPKSYFLTELHTVRIPHQGETVNGMFTLYKIIRIGLS